MKKLFYLYLALDNFHFIVSYLALIAIIFIKGGFYLALLTLAMGVILSLIMIYIINHMNN